METVNESLDSATQNLRSLREINMTFKHKDQNEDGNNGDHVQEFDDRDRNEMEFYPLFERSGFNFGKDIVRMICSMHLGKSETMDFLRGVNKSVFRELKFIESRKV